MMGPRVVRSCSNCALVAGLKIGSEPRSIVLLGSCGSMTTLPAVGALRPLLMPMAPKRSSAWRRSASFSVRRRRSRFCASVSSSLSSSSASARARARSAWRSAILWVLLFLFAAASASALALASAAFFAFSRSTSESSAASQESKTSLSSASSSSNLLRRTAPTTGELGAELEDSSSSSSAKVKG